MSNPKLEKPKYKKVMVEGRPALEYTTTETKTILKETVEAKKFKYTEKKAELETELAELETLLSQF
jgi:hypothetical protein